MIIIGCDSAGYDLKLEIEQFLNDEKISFEDVGTIKDEKTDYPIIAKTVAQKVVQNKENLGILCCGTGIGMSMAANKIKGVRAACCSDYFSAKYTRAHNDANILCIGGRVLGAGLAKELVKVFLETEFDGGRHQKRVEMIADLEK
ncbi:MAG: ribose 5-phosphate isomerase B [Oscillospiraceae bacterium]